MTPPSPALIEKIEGVLARCLRVISILATAQGISYSPGDMVELVTAITEVATELRLMREAAPAKLEKKSR